MDINMKKIKIIKGMLKESVNECLKHTPIRIDDEIYQGNTYRHKWKCMVCNRYFINTWISMRKWNRDSIKCNYCIYDDYVLNIKNLVNSVEGYEFLIMKKVNKSSVMTIRHKYCGSEYDIRPDVFINQNHRCPNCCKKYENSFAYHIEVELGLKLEDIWDFDKNTVNPYHIYKNYNKSKVWIKCQNKEVNKLNNMRIKDYHGSYQVTPNKFVNGQRCQLCCCIHGLVHPLDSFGYYNFDKVMSWHPDNDISPFRVTKTTKDKYGFICETCSHRFMSSAGDVNMGTWCPECSASKGERRIKIYLEKNNIEYSYNKSYFNDLLGVGGLPLRPDFILPNHKIWIEYDGEFHFKKYYAEQNYENLKEHDKRKNEYAKKHGWKMIRIPYTKFDEIETILEDVLSER